MEKLRVTGSKLPQLGVKISSQTPRLVPSPVQTKEGTPPQGEAALAFKEVGRRGPGGSVTSTCSFSPRECRRIWSLPGTAARNELLRTVSCQERWVHGGWFVLDTRRLVEASKCHQLVSGKRGRPVLCGPRQWSRFNRCKLQGPRDYLELWALQAAQGE